MFFPGIWYNIEDVNIIQTTAKVSGTISDGMDGFDMLSMGLGIRRIFMNLLVNNEVNDCVALLINSLQVCHFKKFIECINKKENWTEELCWCAFEKSDDNKEYYVFETFEDDTYTMLYNEFLEVVKIAIIRFYLGTNDDKNKGMLKDSIKNTVFESTLINIDPLLAPDISLVYG